MAKGSRIEIFANKTGKILAEKICKDMNLNPDNLKITRFNDTEILPEITESIRGADVFFIAPFYPNPKTRLVESNLVGDATDYSFPNRKIAITTYLGFTRADWKPKSRTSINIREVAENLEHHWNYVVTFHMHSPQIQGVFRIPFDSFLPIGVFKDSIESEYDKDKLAIVSPDLGGADYANLFREYLGAKAFAIVYKRRPKPGEAESLGFFGDVKDKTAIIVDDLIDTGGSVIKAADLCLERGARDVEVYATHGLFSRKIKKTEEVDKPYATRYIETFIQDEEDLKEELGMAMSNEGFLEPVTYKVVSRDESEARFYEVTPVEYLLKNSHIKKVVVTDSIPRRQHYLNENKEWLRQVSIVPVLEELIDRIHNDKSTSNLYKQ